MADVMFHHKSKPCVFVIVVVILPSLEIMIATLDISLSFYTCARFY